MSGFQYANDMSVPAADSIDNMDSSDVLGSKLDGHDGDSALALLHTLNEHAHGGSKVYPTLATPENVVAGAAWVLGAFKEIVPVGGITEDFDIHYVSIEGISANDTYELVLYAVEVEIGRVRFVKNAGIAPTINIPIQAPIIPANTQIKAKLASLTGGSDVDISLFYHEY